MVRIAIVGARRRKQGLGEFLARILHEQGADISAVVGSTKERAEETRLYLHEKYGIGACAYGDLPSLFAADSKIDAVAICSPHHFHLQHLTQCLAAGVHVLCEKPLIWDDRENPAGAPRLDLAGETQKILAGFRAAGRRLFLNAQWPYTLLTFRDLFPDANLTRIKTFEMGISPPAPGIAMIPESAPHAVSLILALMGPGAIETIEAVYEDAPAQNRLTLSFRYRHARGESACRLRYDCTEEFPRPTHVVLDGLRMDRVVRLPTYEIGFTDGKRVAWSGDPLKSLAADFLKAIEKGPAANSKKEDLDLFLHSKFIEQLAVAVEKI